MGAAIGGEPDADRRTNPNSSGTNPDSESCRDPVGIPSYPGEIFSFLKFHRASVGFHGLPPVKYSLREFHGVNREIHEACEVRNLTGGKQPNDN